MSKHFAVATLALMGLITQANGQKTFQVSHFDKVVVSPHIEVVFVQGDKESVEIKEANVAEDKINVVVANNTLRIYLEGAKEITKTERSDENGYDGRKPIYHGTQLKAVVTYRQLDDLSIRGEETQICESLINQESFHVTLYGEPHLILKKVALDQLSATIYGESQLKIEEGAIKDQHYITYGESEIDALAIKGETAKLTAYGESEFCLNMSDEIRLTSFGEVKLSYTGSASVRKSLQIGEATIQKID